MIITKQKQFRELLKILVPYQKIFLIGCGDCAATCKTGGKDEVLKIKELLEKENKTITGFSVPDVACTAAQVKTCFAQNRKAVEEADAILVFACGLGIQCVKENDRANKLVFPGNDTLCAAALDAQGNFQELCSACGECVLEFTGGICPVTRCSKGLLNGPCGGVNKGKCEVDLERDCAWVLIYQELEKKKLLEAFKKINPAKDYSKTIKPRKITLN